MTGNNLYGTSINLAEVMYEEGKFESKTVSWIIASRFRFFVLGTTVSYQVVALAVRMPRLGGAAFFE